MTRISDDIATKVPAVTLGFWIIKIAATTLGETGGDTVTMTTPLGLSGRDGAVSGGCWWRWLSLQILAKKFHPAIYWATIVASTTFGTTMADFADRSLGIGYTGGSALLFVCLMAVLGLWYWSLGSISVDTVKAPKVEAFYWAAITFSQTLGTALGDWMADSTGLGYEGGALVFGAAIGGGRGDLLLDQRVARAAVLGSVYPDPPARGDGRRLPRQAVKSWRAGAEPSNCLGNHRGFHCWLHPPTASKGWQASGSTSNSDMSDAAMKLIGDIRGGSAQSRSLNCDDQSRS